MNFILNGKMKLHPKTLVHRRTTVRIIKSPLAIMSALCYTVNIVRNSVRCYLRPSLCSYEFKRGRANTSRGCMARDGGAEELKGKGEGVKGLKEMKGTV